MGRSNRKRINISVDPKTYERLQKIRQIHGFRNPCSLVLAFVHILVDHVEDADKRRYDLPDDEDEYIDDMFKELGGTERTPDGTVPVRHPNKDRYG